MNVVAFKTVTNIVCTGGTVDITIRQVLEDRTLREVHQATGGAWGGMKVNANFLEFISELIGINELTELRLNYKADYLDLERSIEMKKRHLEVVIKGRILIALPPSLKKVYKNLNKGAKLTNKLTFESKYAGKVNIQKGHLRMKKEIVAGFFKPVVIKIVKHLKDLLSLPKASGLEDIILVGEFDVIKKTLTEIFSSKRVLVTEDAGLFVLKGAVLYGHNPNAFLILRKRFLIAGQTYCGDCFGKIAEIGMYYIFGEGQDIELNPFYGDLTKMSVDIYKSTGKDHVYVTDKGCSFLGRIFVDMPNTSLGKKRRAKVRITFGKTKILARVACRCLTHLATGPKLKQCQLLCK
ncbi:Heat shock 70 kDa protein 12B [Mizuhopecten yessoensis]|uniref:Heat shock 70 kDa protein 12B n=1 Tax=Mizuhopecten yessoensis TaxID=6573 RepID=A0A210QNR9_MIZYE|nr:Heat shock 70 kDa protein 12B [Mizuhopecten yessoensis]